MLQGLGGWLTYGLDDDPWSDEDDDEVYRRLAEIVNRSLDQPPRWVYWTPHWLLDDLVFIRRNLVRACQHVVPSMPSRSLFFGAVCVGVTISVIAYEVARAVINLALPIPVAE